MAVQIDVSRDIFQRGAYQDRPARSDRTDRTDTPTQSSPANRGLARVVKPARTVQPLDLHPQILQIRKKRRARRIRQAGSALVWTAGSSALITLVMGGLIGLR